MNIFKNLHKNTSLTNLNHISNSSTASNDKSIDYKSDKLSRSFTSSSPTAADLRKILKKNNKSKNDCANSSSGVSITSNSTSSNNTTPLVSITNIQENNNKSLTDDQDSLNDSSSIDNNNNNNNTSSIVKINANVKIKKFKENFKVNQYYKPRSKSICSVSENSTLDQQNHLNELQKTIDTNSPSLARSLSTHIVNDENRKDGDEISDNESIKTAATTATTVSGPPPTTPPLLQSLHTEHSSQHDENVKFVTRRRSFFPSFVDSAKYHHSNTNHRKIANKDDFDIKKTNTPSSSSSLSSTNLSFFQKAEHLDNNSNLDSNSVNSSALSSLSATTTTSPPSSRTIPDLNDTILVAYMTRVHLFIKEKSIQKKPEFHPDDTFKQRTIVLIRPKKQEIFKQQQLFQKQKHLNSNSFISSHNSVSNFKQITHASAPTKPINDSTNSNNNNSIIVGSSLRSSSLFSKSVNSLNIDQNLYLKGQLPTTTPLSTISQNNNSYNGFGFDLKFFDLQIELNKTEDECSTCETIQSTSQFRTVRYCYISDVQPKSSATKAGLNKGDILLEIGNYYITIFQKLTYY
jgi:hypothetical protein